MRLPGRLVPQRRDASPSRSERANQLVRDLAQAFVTVFQTAILLASAAFCREPQVHFSIIGPEPGPWPQIFSSIGLTEQDSELARVFVLRTATPASKQWIERVEHGTLLVLEGESPAAELFGFQGGKERVRVGRVVDARRPYLPIIWQETLDIPRFAVPERARVFATERWTGAPLLAGYRRGGGAVLWVATN